MTACRRKVAGLQCHSLRSGQHSIRRVFFRKLKCAVSPAKTEWKPEVPNVCFQSGDQVWCFVLETPFEVNRYLTYEDIMNITILFYEIGPIFRSCHERLLWDCMGNHQGQLISPSQEERWVASIKRKLKLDRVFSTKKSWISAMLKPRLAPPPTTKASWSPPSEWS